MKGKSIWHINLTFKGKIRKVDRVTSKITYHVSNISQYCCTINDRYTIRDPFNVSSVIEWRKVFFSSQHSNYRLGAPLEHPTQMTQLMGVTKGATPPYGDRPYRSAQPSQSFCNTFFQSESMSECVIPMFCQICILRTLRQMHHERGNSALKV